VGHHERASYISFEESFRKKTQPPYRAPHEEKKNPLLNGRERNPLGEPSRRAPLNNPPLGGGKNTNPQKIPRKSSKKKNPGYIRPIAQNW